MKGLILQCMKRWAVCSEECLIEYIRRVDVWSHAGVFDRAIEDLIVGGQIVASRLQIGSRKVTIYSTRNIEVILDARTSREDS